MYKNVASQKVAVFAYDISTDTPKTGDQANITAQISRDGGGCSATNDANPTELDATNAKGIYIFDMTQAETSGDLVIISPVSATANIKIEPVILYTVSGAKLTAVPWNSDWDTEVQSEVDDALVAQRLDELVNADSDIDGATPPVVGSVFHELLTKTAGSFTYDQTTDSLEANRDNAGNAGADTTEILTRLPDATAGAAGGLLIAGTNDSVTFTNAVTMSKGLVIAQGTVNGDGIVVTGNGSGAGISVNAGVTGIGLKVATTAGDGISVTPTGGNAIVLTGNGTSKHGAIVTGGTAGTSDGIKAVAGTGGVDIRGAITGNITGTVSKSPATIAVGDIANNAITAAAIADAAIDNATFAADIGSTAYAANIIALAADKAILNYDGPTRTEATADKDSIIVVANANETKIDTMQGNVTSILTDTNELQGLVSSSKIAAQVKGIDADLITASVFDESTAFPVKSADTGITQIARVGADGDTLETLSDQIDLVQAVTTLVSKWITNKLVFTGTSMILYDDNGSTPLKTWTISQGTLTIAAPYNRAKAT